MSDQIEHDPQGITEGDGDQSSDNIASSDNHEELEETQPHHYDIVPQSSDGDVIWQCKDKVTFLVSYAVLRLSSDCFRKLFDGGIKEGQELRTAANPQKIPSGEEDSYALRRLFCLLHHQPDPDPDQTLMNQSGTRIASAAQKLRNFAMTVDFYECSKALNKATDSMLQGFSMPTIRDKMSFQATADLVSAAYKLKNSRYFRLFTKRLLTDHAEGFEAADMADGVPDTRIMLELSRQSANAWKALASRMQLLGVGNCTAYRHQHTAGVTDPLWMPELSACILPPLKVWPASRENGVSLRHMLSGIYRLERIQRVSWCDMHKTTILETVDQRDFAMLCKMTDLTISGVCLNCVRSPENRSAICRCAVDAANMGFFGTLELVSKDSFLVKAE
jgi:hypothetical protein